MSREKCGKTLDKALPTSAETGFQFYRVVFLELRTDRMSKCEADNEAIKPTTVFSTYPKAVERHLVYAFQAK
ncbi:hypothetical protein [Coleofasciculus sp. H7-2]|uniref:hypothetical protein n=1 Tax=Coleofasciculus sp. H7-2 TaxID=3351545 RepID=UPI00366ECB55